MFEPAPADGVVFRAATGLDANIIATVQARVRRRLLRVLVRRSLLPSDDAQAMAQWEHGGGFSVDGSVRIEAVDRAGRERLLRYYARPPFALDRLRELDPEHLLCESTRQGPGETGPQRLTLLQLLDRLAALVPPPRVHRHRYFGVPARIYEVFPLACSRCGAEMRIVAFLTDPSTIRDILGHLGEPTAPPRIAPARGPPLWDLPDARTGNSTPQAQPAPEDEFDQRITG